MSNSLDQIAKDALALPAASRALLADQLLESLEGVDADELKKIWAAEAIRRRDEVRSGKVASILGEEVIAEARRMVGR